MSLKLLILVTPTIKLTTEIFQEIDSALSTTLKIPMCVLFKLIKSRHFMLWNIVCEVLTSHPVPMVYLLNGKNSPHETISSRSASRKTASCQLLCHDEILLTIFLPLSDQKFTFPDKRVDHLKTGRCFPQLRCHLAKSTSPSVSLNKENAFPDISKMIVELQEVPVNQRNQGRVIKTLINCDF